MKIVFLSELSDFNVDLQDALKRTGVEVIFFRDNQVLSCPLFLSAFLWRLIRRVKFLKDIAIKMLSKRLVRLCQKEKPQILLTTKGITISKEALLRMKELGVKTVNWHLENIYFGDYYKWFKKIAPHYDLFIKMDSSKIAGIDTGYLPVAVNPNHYQIEPNEQERQKYACDICFVGSHYPDRERLLSSLTRFDLKIFGNAAWQKSSLRNSYCGGPLSLVETAKVFKCAKISLNFHVKPDTCRGINLRAFEIPAAGGFELSDYRPDAENLFLLGQEIEMYKNEKELVEKAKFFLAHDDLRKKIAQSGQRRILKDHTFDKRVQELMRICIS